MLNQYVPTKPIVEFHDRRVQYILEDVMDVVDGEDEVSTKDKARALLFAGMSVLFRSGMAIGDKHLTRFMYDMCNDALASNGCELVE